MQSDTLTRPLSPGTAGLYPTLLVAAILSAAAMVPIYLGYSAVVTIGVVAALSASFYLISRPSHDRAFRLTILTLPFLAAFVIDIGGNFRVPYFFAVIALFMGIYQRSLYPIRPNLATCLLAAFVIYALLSVALAFKLEPPSQVISFGFRTSEFRPIIQAGQLGLMLIFFYLTFNYTNSTDRLHQVSLLISWSLCVVIFYSTYEMVAAIFDLPFVNINTNPDDFLENRFAGTQLAHAGGILIPRPRSILSEPSHLSSYILFSLPFAVAILQFTRSTLVRWVLLGFIGLTVLIFVLTWSRAGFAAIAVVIPMMFVLVRTWRTRLRMLIAGASVYLLLGMAVFPILGAKPSLFTPVTLLSERLSTFQYLGTSFTGPGYGTARIGRSFYVPLGVFKEHPLTGVGLGNYQLAKARFMNSPLTITVAGNLYMELLTEFGIVGTTLFLSFVGLVLWGLWKVIKYSSHEPLVPFAIASFISIVGVMGTATAVSGLTIYPVLWVTLAIGLAIAGIGYRARTGARTLAPLESP